MSRAVVIRSAGWTVVAGAGLLVATMVLGAARPVSDGASGPGDPTAAQDTPVVVLETTMGTIVLELYPWKAPISVQNFLSYVRAGYYRGIIFHRVVEDFAIQAGGYTRSLQPRSTFPPIENESDNGLSNKRGTIAVARLANPNSGTSQFYINVSNNSNLDFKGPQRDWGYAVFGRVREGMDVVDAISEVETGVMGGAMGGGAGMADVPLEPVVIRSAAIVED